MGLKNTLSRQFLRSKVKLVASIGFLLLTMSGLAQAETLKNSDFLKMSEEQRHWWYVGAYTTLGHVAAMDDKSKGECVWNWFFSDSDGRIAQLVTSFEKYPKHSPTTIILALLRRDCGAFKRE